MDTSAVQPVAGEAVFAAIADERRQLADLLATLDARQLATPSWCDGWTVHHVAAHLTTLFNVGMGGMAWRVVLARGNFSKAVDRLTAELAQRPIDTIIDQLREHAEDRAHPPGRPLAPLTDLIVHGEDIRRPLGISRQVPLERTVAALGFIASGRATGFLPRGRLDGLQLMATDTDAAWGVGQAVHGPAIDLLLAALGRRRAFAALGGATRTLESRLAGGRARRTPPRV
jgi:uncharacterized protein (TIGR03083 family)